MAVVSWGTAALFGAIAAAAGLPVWGTTGFALAALGFVKAARSRYRHLDELSRYFVISPGGLAEVSGTDVRGVPWQAPLVLRNNPGRSRFELAIHGTAAQLDIPYTVVRVERLLTLIVTKGNVVIDR